jgi:hypothetical protein
MQSLVETAPAFVDMAHNIVWCSAATVDKRQRPWSRILHPIWQWDGESLTGWIATGPTPIKRAHLAHSAYISLNYWSPSQDTCVAECETRWLFDDADRQMVWDLFLTTPPPLGYDPAMIPVWEKPTDAGFAVLKLDPWRLRVFPGSVLLEEVGDVLVWQRDD